jgi:hypothetical protein
MLRRTLAALAFSGLAAAAACNGENGGPVSATLPANDGGATEASVSTDGASSSTDGASASTDGEAGATALSACDAIDLPAPAPGAGFQFQVPLTLGAGQEREVCQLVKLPQDLDLNWSDGIMSDPSHHALVQTTGYSGTIPTTTLDGQTLDGTQVHTCSTPSALWQVGSVIAGGRHVSQAATQPDNVLPKGAIPSNVAFKLKAGDYVLVNFHMLNSSDQTMNACYKVNLNGVPDSQVTTEAGMIFWYNNDIAVPASSTQTARMACPITQDISLASAVSHAHMRLANYGASLLTDDPENGGTKVQDLYTGTNWDSPPTKIFPQPIAISKGHWIDYHCDYQNGEARNVAQGLQTTDEMCMFIGAYWPRDSNLERCATDGSTSAVYGNAGYAGRLYGTGTKSGADFLSCFWSTPLPDAKVPGSLGGPSSSDARYAHYSCTAQTCTKASGPIAPYVKCVIDNKDTCQSQCTTLQSSFQAICASTPATTSAGPDGGTVEAKDGCKAEYGTDGSDGTCAASAQNAAIAACTTPAQTAELSKQCAATLCASACAADAGSDGGTCAACVGQFTGSTTDPTCLNQLTLACVADQTKSGASACVTQCFTDCITTRATSCTLDCINATACKAQYDAIATATCN